MGVNRVDGTTLRRGLDILVALGSEAAMADGGLRVGQVAALLGHDKSQVSRTLKTLAEAGFVERDAESLAYRLGWGVFTLAGRAGDQRLLVEARPFLKRLVRELSERAHLSVLQGTHVLTLDSETPLHTVQTAGWVGRTVPAYCTSAGRALLIDCDRDALLALFGARRLPPAGPRSPRDIDDLWTRVAAARTRGFAIVDEEFEPGLVAVAAPLRDFTGKVIAALNLSAPKFRLGEHLEAAGTRTKAAADELSARLGRPADKGSRNGAATKDGAFSEREHHGIP